MMQPHKQLFRHDPKNGVYGDCYRTCIANLLDMHPSEVPHFNEKCEGNEPNLPAFMASRDWLADRGLSLVDVPYQCDMDMLKKIALQHFPGVYYLLAGTSGNGVNHNVVALDGDIVSDPSQNDAGIIGPCDDGYYWITFFVGNPFIAARAQGSQGGAG